MATLKAGLLTPGDKFYAVDLVDSPKLDTVKVRILECVRCVVIPAGVNTPEMVCVTARDNDDPKELAIIILQPHDEVVKVPKPGKWRQICNLLLK